MLSSVYVFDWGQSMSETAIVTTVRSALEYVVGLNHELARRVLQTTHLEIDGKVYTNPEARVSLEVGSRICLEGHSTLNVIKAHIRTLNFYHTMSASSA